MKRITSVAKCLALSLVAVLVIIGSFALTATSASAANVTIKMGADNGMLLFVPDKVSVSPGDTVQFVINKVPPHNVIFDAKAIPGGDKALAKALSHQALEATPNSSFDITIPKDAPAGEYNFFCAPHRSAGMVGKIIVGG